MITKHNFQPLHFSGGSISNHRMLLFLPLRVVATWKHTKYYYHDKMSWLGIKENSKILGQLNSTHANYVEDFGAIEICLN